MVGEKLWRVAALSAALVAAVAWLIAGHQATQAGDTFGNAHCLSTPPNCIYPYSPDGNNLIATQTSFAIHDYRFSDVWPDVFESALDSAEYNWAVAAGPQTPMEPVSDELTFSIGNIYLNCLTQGDPAGSCSLAKAYVCPVIPPNNQVEGCDRFNNKARNIIASETYVNVFALIVHPATTKIHVFAHELGHTLRLAHHESGVCLMNTQLLPVTAPSTLLACDLGFANPFSSPKLAPCDRDVDKLGVRCMYEWWREQGVLLDCFDPNRDGRVTIGDINIAVSAFGGTAGEDTYHPDTDVNLDGATVIGDILGIVGQFGDVCAVNHYNNS